MTCIINILTCCLYIYNNIIQISEINAFTLENVKILNYQGEEEMKKKLVATTLCAALIAAMTAGCGGGNKTTDKTSSGSMDEIKVNIWDSNQQDGLQQIADKWTEKSGIKVSIEVVDWNNYWTLLEAGAQGAICRMYSGCIRIQHRCIWKMAYF